MSTYDVIVVGGGHAGCEAAIAAARIGARTALITLRKELTAFMPCNPSIGGIGKSHLVFELDALGGEMAVNTDCTGIQFRTLNTSRGPAVHSNRAQCDKARYSQRMLAIVESEPLIDIIEAKVANLAVRNGILRGIETDTRAEIDGNTVVLTPGTSMTGRIHIGKSSTSGGGNGAESVDQMSICLKDLGFELGRLKTGTPPRLAGNTVNYDQMEIQCGEYPPPLFSWEMNRGTGLFHVEHGSSPDRALFHVEHADKRLYPWNPGTAQLPCYLTHTTEITHDIIREHLSESALYGGSITGTGARYCPSVEDKVVRFPDKFSHHIFIEPEGRDSPLVYPNGISNSLPESVQNEIVHSIPGLENAEIMCPAFAIEYDFSNPTQLLATLESKIVENLFLAGQINGTTGYEEAAAQGFLAGVNAARKALGNGTITISRQDAYIGVMVDDLVTKGTSEPYRMFTSRAERRLILRQDNARFRMLSLAREIGVVNPEYLKETLDFQHSIEIEMVRLSNTRHAGIPLIQLLKQPDVRYVDLLERDDNLHADVKRQIEIQAKYEGYIQREEVEAGRAREWDMIAIPPDADFIKMKTLSREAQEKLTVIRPANLGQASRIPGITPADICTLSILLHKK